jgi:hypothetical protein
LGNITTISANSSRVGLATFLLTWAPTLGERFHGGLASGFVTEDGTFAILSSG